MPSGLPFTVATVIAFALATLAWTSPLLPHVRTSYLEALADPTALSRADAMLTSWMLAWGSHALRTNPLGLFHANIFYPLPWTFAFSENLIASALLITPLDVLARDPVLDHNVFLLASFTLCGIGTALLVRELGGALPAAWLAGAVVTFDPFRFATIGHIHALSTHWMPFALLAVHRCVRRGRGAVAVAIAVMLVTFSSVYYAYFFLLALAVFVPAHWLFGCPAAPGGRRRALAGIGVAAAITAVVLWPYFIARDVYAFARPVGEAWFFAARGIVYLGGVTDPVGYVRQRYVANENVPVVIGPLTLVLMLAGLAQGAAPDRGGRRTAAAYLATAVMVAIVSLGPGMQWRPGLDPGLPGPWTWLAALVPGWSALRVPVRACTVVVLAVAVLAAFGAQALWSRARRPIARGAVLVSFIAIAVLESWRPPFERIDVGWAGRTMPNVYRWLAAQPGRDAVAELPIGLPATDAADMIMSSVHWKPLVNGYSGFTPTMSFFRGFFAAFPSPSTIRFLHQLGVRWVVVHPADMPPMRRALCSWGAAKLGAYAGIVYGDQFSCVIEIRGEPPAPLSPPPDRPIVLADATVTTSSGDDARAAIDGRLDTHWTETVDRSHESWLQLDLPQPRTISRLIVQLGPHFGEFMRQWRIDTSLDGVVWQTAGVDRNAVPPLLEMRRDPARLSSEMQLEHPISAKHVRLVRPAAEGPDFDLWDNWTSWGVHELQLFEAAS